jgi:HEAT repeat protein
MTDWISWFNFGVPALVGVSLLLSSLGRRHRRLQLWRETLAQCGLTEVKSSGFWVWRPKLMARSGLFKIWIIDARGKGDEVKVVIEGPEGFSDVKLRRQIFKLWTREIEVGDEAFDDAFLVDGPIRPVHARLDAALRRQLVRASAVCNPLDIDGGQIRVEVSDKVLPRILPLLLEISRQLAEPVDVERQIARNARRDPKAGVRLTNLLLLIRERPGDPETLRALRSACSDASPEVRLQAALALGEEGRKVLLKLAEESTDDASNAQAVLHLGGKLSLENARNILSRSLRKGLFLTARACLKVLGQRRAAAIGTLERVMTEEKGELAAAAALALGATDEADAEPSLLQALQSDDSDLQEAAATALGRVGSAAAVQPLKDAAESTWFDLGLRRAARQSIAEIQARLEGASPGQLSLADTEAGQLSLAHFEAGQLSLAPHAESAGEWTSSPPAGAHDHDSTKIGG